MTVSWMLRGLPFYDDETKRTVWYRPEDLPDDSAHPAILSLDELTAAAPALQLSVYGLLQERLVGRHLLPASTFIVAAGNAVEDGALTDEMGTALSDRLIHLSVRAEASEWLKSYAVPRELHPAVTAFIRTRPDLPDTTEDAMRHGQTVTRPKNLRGNCRTRRIAVLRAISGVRISVEVFLMSA